MIIYCDFLVGDFNSKSKSISEPTNICQYIRGNGFTYRNGDFPVVTDDLL